MVGSKESYGSVESRIQEAIAVLLQKGEENPNLAAAAREFNLPPQRLRARWNGRESKEKRVPVNRKLTEEEELAVCQYLDRLDHIGTSARLHMITTCANAILLHAQEDPSIPTPVVSEHWARRFLTRHPEYHIRKQYTLDADRKNAHHPESILDWFSRYEKVCDKYGIQSRDRYNFDETGFRIGIGRDQWIVTRDPTRQAYLGSSTNRELVTVCETISADGHVLPPMIIISGIIHQEHWYTETKIPDDYYLSVSDTGYSNDFLCMKWLGHFDLYSAQRQIGAYRLLLLDGYGSHCTREFIEYCDNAKIIPFCLPPHTSHLLQPLDVVVFQPYKHYHSEAIEAATRTGCTDFDKVEFLTAIDSIRQQTFKPSTICSAFRATGLVPYNPSVVLARLRESQVSTSPLATLPRSSLSQPPVLAQAQPPLTTHSLKRQGEDLQQAAINMNLSPIFQENLRLVLKGGMVQAISGERAVADLGDSKAAEKARAGRQKSRRTVQKGGQLYAHQARNMVRQREEEDLQKAEIALRRAQFAMTKARSAERQPFLTAVKEYRQKMRTIRAARKKLMKTLCLEIRKVGRSRRRRVK